MHIKGDNLFIVISNLTLHSIMRYYQKKPSSNNPFAKRGLLWQQIVILYATQCSISLLSISVIIIHNSRILRIALLRYLNNDYFKASWKYILSIIEVNKKKLSLFENAFIMQVLACKTIVRVVECPLYSFSFQVRCVNIISEIL